MARFHEILWIWITQSLTSCTARVISIADNDTGDDTGNQYLHMLGLSQVSSVETSSSDQQLVLASHPINIM